MLVCAGPGRERYQAVRLLSRGYSRPSQEDGLKDYLVLLSICHTCHYRGISFLRFLLSRERDMDAFCERPRRRRRSPSIEIYPRGVVRPDFVGQHAITNRTVDDSTTQEGLAEQVEQ